MKKLNLLPKNSTQSDQKISPNDTIQMPITLIPAARTTIAAQAGVERNILIRTWGGLGDQVCAEPAIRYAMKHFKDCNFTLASEKPDLFQHLKFERVFDLNYEQPLWDKYLMFTSIHDPSHISWQFFSHMLTHCVDYCSINMFRLQMPIADREVQLGPKDPPAYIGTDLIGPVVLVHAGRHWQTKTFPPKFWNAVLKELIKEGVSPILIGANTDDNRGTVDVDPTGCVDLRNKTNLNDLMWLCKAADVVLTNDSSPLHIAAAGNAHIGFIATCKHPDYITHYRKGVFGWRMKNFGKGGIWDYQNYCPNATQTLEVDKIDPKILESWLPDPKEFAQWAVEKAKDASSN